MFRSVVLPNRRHARVAIAAGLLAVAGSAALHAAATCRSRPGECAVVSTRSGPTWEEIVVQVGDAARGFTLDLTRDGRTLTLVWKAPADGRLRPCTAPASCAAAGPPVCDEAVVCGMLHATSYCGSFLSSDTIELRFRWCRAEDDPWPPTGAPLPIQNPPPPPPPKKPKLPEDERRDPPGPPKAPEETQWFVERIQKANALDRPWQAEGHLTTRKGLPSTVAARHVPGVSWMSAGVAGETPTEAFVTTTGRMVARRGAASVYLEIRPEPGPEPPSGGFVPAPPSAPAISPLRPAPRDDAEKEKEWLVRRFRPRLAHRCARRQRGRLYGLEPAAARGSPAFSAIASISATTVYRTAPTSRRSRSASSRSSAPIATGRELGSALRQRDRCRVFPHDSQVRKLTGDAQKDMAAMMAILGPP